MTDFEKLIRFNESNTKRKEHFSLPDADFRNASLVGFDLNLADLRGADFSHADLQNANLERANLSGANFEGANLTGATLQYAYLYASNLKDTNLTNVELGQPISIKNLIVDVLSMNDTFDLKTREMTIVNSHYNPIPQVSAE